MLAENVLISNNAELRISFRLIFARIMTVGSEIFEKLQKGVKNLDKICAFWRKDMQIFDEIQKMDEQTLWKLYEFWQGLCRMFRRIFKPEQSAEIVQDLQAK